MDSHQPEFLKLLYEYEGLKKCVTTLLVPQWSGAASLPLPCSLGLKMNVHPVTLAHFPTLCESGLQSSLAGTSFPVAGGNGWPAPFPCWPGPHLPGLSMLAQTSGRPIPAVAVTLLSKGQQVGGGIDFHTASVETATPQCPLLPLCSHGEFCFSGSHCQCLAYSTQCQICHSSTQEVEVGGSGIQDQLWLHSSREACPTCIRSPSKQTENLLPGDPVSKALREGTM